MHKCRLRHENCLGQNKLYRHSPDFIRGLVKLWKQRRNEDHQYGHPNTAGDGKCDDFIIRISGFLHLTRSEELPYNNCHRISQGNKYHIEHIIDCICYIQSCNHTQSPNGIALGQHGHPRRPQGLIDQKRRTFDKEFPHEMARHFQRAVNPCNIWILLPVSMSPQNNHSRLHIPGNDCCHCGAYHPKGRQTQFPVYQQIIQAQINRHCSYPRLHGYNSLAAFSKGTDINLQHHKCRKAQKHHLQIIFPVM